jgi:PAS domain S-box-containing protein
MGVFWAADWQGSHESVYLLLTLNIIFSLLVCLVVAYLIARSFLVRSTPGLLLLGCGVAIWGPAGVVATAAARGDANISITIYNSCLWLSGLCHLAAVSLSLRSRRSLSPPALWLLAGCAHAVGAVVLVTLLTLAGWMPTFFVEERGGTPVRQVVLISAITMFALTALLLGITKRKTMSAFAYWYALALLLIAAGLLGVTLQSYHASILGWTGRATQALGGLYMLIAAVASVRESRVWGISLEGALKEERDFSAAVLDTAGALVVVLDAQGRITRFNRACERLTGYTAADVLGRACREFLIPPDEVAGVQEAWQAVLAGSSSNHHENHWLARDGTRRLIDWSNTALAGEGGEVRHVIAIGIDITDRRRAEETLRESQALMHAVMDGSPDLIYMKDLDGRVLIANPAACEALGRSAQEVIGKTAREFHSDQPEMARAIMENDRRVMESGETETIEEVGGKGRTYLSTKAPYRGAAGNVIGLIGISHDITERKRAEEALRGANEDLQAQAEQLRTLNDALEGRQKELQTANEDLRVQEEELRSQAEALRESEERYRTLFDTAPDAIVVHRDGRFLHANDAALRLIGAGSFEELARHAVLDFFRPEERNRVLERTRTAMAGQRLPMRETTLERLDGQEVAVEFHVAPVDFQGARAVQTIVRDVTERRRSEQALRELNAALERRVAERTAELEHRAKQLQKLTLELSQAQERERKRVAEILHEDLQQQIAGAKFQLNLLSSRSQDDRSRQLTAAQINQILKDAIGMSRSLSHELSPAVFYGNDLGEALEWLGEQVEANHGLTVHVEVLGEGTLQSEVLTVFLFRAARELLSNAVRHAGVREAAIRLRRVGQHVSLRVSDQGRGFDPQKLKETPGFGLLSIRERVELLGGRVKIASAKGRGTRVQIVVPDARPDRDTSV